MSGRHEAGAPRPDDELENFKRTVSWSITQTDAFASELLLQVVVLEEVIAARWPRRILVRRRLRRDLRASVAHVQGASWTDRRINSLSTGWMERR